MNIPGWRTATLFITGSGVGGGTGYGVTQSYSITSEKNAVDMTKALYEMAIKDLEQKHKKAMDDLGKAKDKEINKHKEDIRKRDNDGKHFFKQIEYINKETTSPMNCNLFSHRRNMYRDNVWGFTYNGQQIQLKFQDWGCKK